MYLQFAALSCSRMSVAHSYAVLRSCTHFSRRVLHPASLGLCIVSRTFASVLISLAVALLLRKFSNPTTETSFAPTVACSFCKRAARIQAFVAARFAHSASVPIARDVCAFLCKKRHTNVTHVVDISLAS
jgi:hypothetical protein